MSEEKLSIIIPIYNSEKYLERTLNSVINQTYKNLEIILVDDFSQDSSFLICKNFAQDDERIKVIHLEKNVGVSSARNIGLDNSSGKYIQFVDSDDYLEPNACERLVDGIKTSDLVICGFCERGNKDQIFGFKENKVYNFRGDYISFFEFIKCRLIHNIWNKLYKKELISTRFDNTISIGEDVIFNLNYLKNCEDVFTIKDVLYNYDFTNINSIMHTKLREKQELLNYWDKIELFCDNYFASKDYIKTLNGLYLKAIMAQIMNIALRKNLKYREFRKTFLEYRNLQEVKKAIKNYKKNVFINKNKLMTNLLFLVFKTKLVLPFLVITKYRNKKMKEKK